MRRRRPARAPLRRGLCAALLGLLPTRTVLALDWGGSAGITSDNIYRGITYSDNRPSLQADLHLVSVSGCLGGVSAASVRRSSDDHDKSEFDLYAGCVWSPADPWSLRLLADHRDFPQYDPAHRYDYDQAAATLAYADRVFATITFSPDTWIYPNSYQPGDRYHTWAYELALHQPIVGALSANAGIGIDRAQITPRGHYTYGNAGLAYDFGRVQLDLSYIGASDSARPLAYDGTPVHRTVASLIWRFH